VLVFAWNLKFRGIRRLQLALLMQWLERIIVVVLLLPKKLVGVLLKLVQQKLAQPKLVQQKLVQLQEPKVRAGIRVKVEQLR
jgi:hypothetical protein